LLSNIVVSPVIKYTNTRVPLNESGWLSMSESDRG
jgi:hypothetical protein